MIQCHTFDALFFTFIGMVLGAAVMWLKYWAVDKWVRMQP
jgi:hypothetical protein